MDDLPQDLRGIETRMEADRDHCHQGEESAAGPGRGAESDPQQAAGPTGGGARADEDAGGDPPAGAHPARRRRPPPRQRVVLFYKYHPLSDDPAATGAYRLALEGLCRSLDLSGRILVGCSSTSEGINGTLAGSYWAVKAFTLALSDLQTQKADAGGEGDRSSALASALSGCGQGGGDDGRLTATLAQRAVERYWRESRSFFDRIAAPVLVVPADEFKWSVHDPDPASSSSPNAAGHNNMKHDNDSSTLELFPDLNVKLVDELIGSGGAMKGIPIGETSTGYLTPREWHEEVSRRDPGATVLVDCRNAKECEIGRFESSISPGTTAYSQFPRWVEQNRHLLENKTVYMSCTGGIRCEKSAAYVRRAVPSAVEVKHLRGGIHKYLEAYGDRPDSLWRGRNFVFDGRGAATARGTFEGRDGGTGAGAGASEAAPGDPESTDAVPPTEAAVVGRCVPCGRPFDRFDPRCVCTVCREPTLACPACRRDLAEYHCRAHRHLSRCYFSDLSRFSDRDLDRQLDELETLLAEIAVGKRFKSKRRTLTKQIAKIREHQRARGEGPIDPARTEPTGACRNCGEAECSGRCWGFYGLKRKEILERRGNETGGAKQARIETPKVKASAQTDAGERRREQAEEVVALGLFLPPSSHRDASTGVRVVPPVTRVVQCRAKGRWCGRPVLSVLGEEFAELARPGVLQRVLSGGLLRVNGEPIGPLAAGQARVRMGDALGRVVHWHEPPVRVPASIPARAVRLPDPVIEEYGLDPGPAQAVVFACDKPATVPVHPAGPYLANSLTLMVEAQEGLRPLSLVPVHRTDRAASGLVLCAACPAAARAFHRSLVSPGAVRKLYLARVGGRFFSCGGGGGGQAEPPLPALPVGRCEWLDGGRVRVMAPVETVDAANGIRAATAGGKPSTSLFRRLAYRDRDDTSLVACCPVTGRSHQLRVHLQLLGFSIVGDVLYGGRSMTDEESVRLSRAALDAMDRSLRHQPQPPENEAGGGGGLGQFPSPLLVSDGDDRAARGVCPACRGVVGSGTESGAAPCFTPAQLLQGGHAVRLHALRYRVSFLRRGAPGRTAAAGGSPVPPFLAACDYRVDPPAWADDLPSGGGADLPFLDGDGDGVMG